MWAEVLKICIQYSLCYIANKYFYLYLSLSAVLGDSYFLLREPMARCKFFLETNLQSVNIIGENAYKFGVFLPN